MKRPIQRTATIYGQSWPSKWYGEPGSGVIGKGNRYPVIYTPTDTTQLGFYYQRVPQWQPMPGMIPAPPNPSTWHDRTCPYESYPRVIRGSVIHAKPIQANETDADTQTHQPAPEPEAADTDQSA